MTLSKNTSIIHTYRFCVGRQRDTPVFRAYAGTVRESSYRPRSIQFDTDSYQIDIANFSPDAYLPIWTTA